MGAPDGARSVEEQEKTPAVNSRPVAQPTRIRDAERVGLFEHHVKEPLKAWYKYYILELVFREKQLSSSANGRHIPLAPSHPKHLIDERRGHGYISNTIRSSRYTVWDFLPKQFFFQTTRLANFYFICIGIPQAIPGFSTTGSYTTILPVAFFLLLTVAKEGYDDFRRHRMDNVENNQFAKVLRERHGHVSHAKQLSEHLIHAFAALLGLMMFWKKSSARDVAEEHDPDEDDVYHWAKVKWHSIQVGDIIKLKRDEPVPADLALLYANGNEGMAYVETMALDGETNLKSKQAPPALKHASDIAGLRASTAEFVVEDPNRDLYDFNGSIEVDGKKMPLTLNDVILRGSVIRNTNTAIGMVINTGEECKIRMNANHHPRAKKPRLEHYVNNVVLSLIFYVVVLSVGCSGGYILWRASTERGSWYLDDASVPFKQIIIGYLIMFNNVIPLALYISLEITKVGQMLMMMGDRGMYDPETNTHMVTNTNTILENLGQVGYILSDKTGTLTENVMRFRGLSVAGTAWSHRSAAETEEAEKRASGRKSMALSRKSFEPRKSGVDQDGRPSAVIVRETELSSPAERRMSDMFSRPSLQRRMSDRPALEEDRLTSRDLLQYVRAHPESEFSKKAMNFILGIAICHTALPETQKDGSIDFQASSPDELALVRAAQDMGFLVANRSTQTITLTELGADGNQNEHVYQILDVIEFTSKRKRMSIIVRCPNGKIWLLCKGADSAVLPRLKQATLAARKSHEVRRSIQIERDMQRKSEQHEPRTSFGGRPSLTIRRRSSLDIRPAATPKRNTLDVPRISHGGEKSVRPSFDRRTTGRGKFAFLDDPAISDDAAIFTRTFRHLDDFATEGLRTLLFADKTLSEDDYADWKKLYQDATTALVNRQERIEAAGELIEQGFSLLGASAIEDKLQKGVPETIEKLRRANMKIWMLTGDKRETAINIAHAARICQPNSDLFILDSTKGALEAQLADIHQDTSPGGVSHTVAVIDGHTLGVIDAHPTLTRTFYALIPLLSSVIVCRASPAQKASIVHAIRAHLSRHTGALTLAIGDGANDLAMINAAHVGVGISGKEGLQAARVADFSIAQFRFLQRLLLVHGRWNYIRTAKFILWTYWKEMFFYLVQALYQSYCGYSGSSLFENWSLTVLNTLFTSLCTIVPGIFEQDLSAETLLAVPELYVFGQRNEALNVTKYLTWMAMAVMQGTVIWYLPGVLYGRLHEMGDNGTYAIGHMCFSIAIMWTNLKLLILDTHHKTLIPLLSFLITTGGWWAWSAFLSHAYSANLSPFDVRGGFDATFGVDWNWWLVLLLTLAVLTGVELGWKAVRREMAVAGCWPPWRGFVGGKGGGNRTAEELDVGVWQEMQRDPVIRARLRVLAGEEEEGEVEVEEKDDERG